MRILLLEDNADHRELMRLALSAHDATWQVDEVVSGEEALRHLAEGEVYDLVFLDYSLPGRDGLEVLEEIRRGGAAPSVVMVTGHGDEHVAVQALKAGAYDYVVKGENYLVRLPVVARRAVEAHHLAAEHELAVEELRSSTKQLRALAGHLQSVREEERARIARAIHDELGQALAGLKMDLVWVASELPAGQTHLLEKAKSMSELVDATVKSARRISTELRPGVLDDLGLVAAIEWQAQEFQRHTGIRCQATLPLVNPKLHRAALTAIFRILQEILTNVARHATASRVTINMKVTTSKLILEVHDNGRGISESAVSSSQSLGLLGIRERTLLLGGEVQIRGIPRKGSRVTLIVPLDRRKSPRESRGG